MKDLSRLAAVAVVCVGAPAAAQTAPAGLALTGNVAVVSDYRFRGISLSDRDPALQGGMDLASESGAFVGAWASTIDDSAGADVELDLYGGYSGSIGGADVTLTALAYVYPGGSDLNYLEFMGEVSRDLGPASLTLEAAYAPDQWNTDTDNLYLAAGVEAPMGETPLTLRARVGCEDGFYERKWDWEIGADYAWKALTLSVAYVATDYDGPDEAGRLGEGALVAGLRADF